MQAIPCRLTEVKAPVAARGEQIAVGDSCSINHDCFPGLLCIHPICLTVFQHVVDPTRVRTVADKNSAVTPLYLRPTVADHVFKGNSIEVRGQFNCTMNMPSTGRATLP